MLTCFRNVSKNLKVSAAIAMFEKKRWRKIMFSLWFLAFKLFKICLKTVSCIKSLNQSYFNAAISKKNFKLFYNPLVLVAHILENFCLFFEEAMEKFQKFCNIYTPDNLYYIRKEKSKQMNPKRFLSCPVPTAAQVFLLVRNAL